jgi:hypothetical protein
MKTISELSQVALGDLNHYWTLEDEREFIRLQNELSAQELAEHFKRDIYEVIVMSLHIKRQQERIEAAEREEKLEYSKSGDLLYNPNYHQPRNRPWTSEELRYLCKYHDKDSMHSIALALERTTRTCKSQIVNLKKTGVYKFYRNWREEA